MVYLVLDTKVIDFANIMWVNRFTNNVLSTAQQVWLRKMGGAKPVVAENASGIISAGKAKRSASQPVQNGDRFGLCFEQVILT